MRLASWNINGLRARFDYARRWLEERRPDIVAWQELKLQDDQFPGNELAELGFECAVHGQKAWNGVAVLSRFPLEVVQVGLPGEEELGARLIGVRTGGLFVFSAYIPNGKEVGHPDFPRKLRWLDRLLEYMAETFQPTDPVVLAGDFNLCPAALDSWNEEELAGTIFHTGDERRRFQAFLEWGFHDLFRVMHPDVQAFSWWDYRAGAFPQNRGLRIDLVLGTAPVRARLAAAGIDRDWRKKKDGLTPSDHAPVWVELCDER
ncbi:MAG TPA: exodeoxyribonuclease III [Acidobacteriota bacterium]|nr:exodeoxyribonuclease III [Acidobacteriota bacterium]